MLDFQQKRKMRTLVYHRHTLIVLGVVVVFAIHSTWTVYQKKIESDMVRKQAENHFDELENREAMINTAMARLATPEGTEAEIRSRFSVAKNDENLVIVVEDKDEVSGTTTQKMTLWQKFVHLFDKR